MSARRAALAIGVGEAPPLPYLGGAVNGAREFHAWARGFGYESRLVTDEDEPVTAARLRGEFEALLSAEPFHRLIIYFAGHGVIRELEQGLWLLSDWHAELRAVAVEVLRRRLALYRVNQVAIFADACRSLPADVDTADLTPDGLLGRGPGPRSATMSVDKFIAAQDGTAAFMIPGADPEDDRCLFSGVALSALWGTQKEAFSKTMPGMVTSRSLGAYLQAEVPRLAETYRLKLVPSVSPTFPDLDDIYYGDGPAVEAPVFPPWPPAGALRIGRQGVTAPEADRDGALIVDRDDGFRQRADTYDDDYADEGMVLVSVDALERRMRQQQRPDHYETGAGFAVDGERVTGVWTAAGTHAETAGRGDWWRLGTPMAGVPDLAPLPQPAPALLHLAGGAFVAVTALPGFIGSVVTGDSGAAALVYRSVYEPSTQAEPTEAAIGRLERGDLRAGDALDLAAELRFGKHMDPVRGVLGAYLYDSVADVESIRRMAYGYITHNQPIPYDIALLADLPAAPDDNGLLVVTVPAVPQRSPRTEKEMNLPWTHSATPEAIGVVAGHWPMLRQGWAYLDDDPGSALVRPGLAELAPELTAARFSTFPHAAGLRLAKLFALTP
ncbi:hypothetical protein ACQPZJ_16485 [Actinoplanes sp. CA-054009]